MPEATKTKVKELKMSRPAVSPEFRESQLIALAVDRAEQQLRDGTASSQLICHYLKLGSKREQIECENLRKQNELLQAKVDKLQSERRTEELYAEALMAMRRYSGVPDEEYESDE